MSLLSIAKDALKSRALRSSATNGTGSRILKSNQKGFFTEVANSLFGVVKWVGNTIFGTLSFGFVTLLNWLRQGWNFMWNFDWNITDQDITKIYNSYKLRWASLIGSTLGNAVGWLLCGGLAVGAVSFFNQTLAAHIAREVGEEALEELGANIASLVRLGADQLRTYFFYENFKNFRKWLKNASKDPDGTVARTGRLFFGKKFDTWMKDWGEKGQKPWSFAKGFQEWTESLGKTPEAKEAIESFWDDFGDACWEALYVVAGGIDEWRMKQRMQNRNLLGQAQAVEIQPHRDSDERLTIMGRDQIIRPIITQTLSNYQLIDNRDMGLFVGEPLKDNVSKVFIKGCALKIMWKEKKTPPYGDCRSAYVTLYNVDVIKLDWHKLIVAMGRTNGYLYGNDYALATFNDIPNLKIQGATGEIAKKVLEDLLYFVQSEMKTMNKGSRLKEGARKKYDKSLHKPPVTMYPAYATFIIREPVLEGIQKGKISTSGYYKEKKYRIPLYTDNKPDSWDTVRNEVIIKLGITDPKKKEGTK